MPKPQSLIDCPRCQQIKDDGARCGSPALRGKKLCKYHDRQRRTFPHRACYRKSEFCRRADFFNVQTPDDVMRALNQVMNAILMNQLSDGEARSIIFALQLASEFAPHTTAAKTMPRVPHPFAQRKGGSVDFPNIGALPPSRLFDPSDQFPITAPSQRPKSLDDMFAMVPGGCDDLKAMLTPDHITSLNDLFEKNQRTER